MIRPQNWRVAVASRGDLVLFLLLPREEGTFHVTESAIDCCTGSVSCASARDPACRNAHPLTVRATPIIAGLYLMS